MVKGDEIMDFFRRLHHSDETVAVDLSVMKGDFM